MVTFRPSALRLAADCVNMESADFHIALNKPKNADGEARVQRPKSANRPRSNSNSSAPEGTHLLSSLDPDSWPTCRVRILGGRTNGLHATVRSSGNGWVQLDTPYGEVAKRANELELLEGPGAASSMDNTALSITRPAQGYTRMRSNSESLVTSPRTSLNTLINSSLSSTSQSRTWTCRGGDEGSRLKLVDAKTRALQQDYIERFIQKQKAKYQNRPDLKYWAGQIRGGMVDALFERDMSRDLRDQYCHTCRMEKWPSAKFCWSELCPSSPVYWKLPGGAGDALGPKRRYEDMQNLLSSQRDEDLGEVRRRAQSLPAPPLSTNMTSEHLSPFGSTNTDTPPAKKKRIHSQDSDVSTTSDVSIEDEQLACRVLGNLFQQPPARFTHTDATVNIVTEFINGMPSIQIGAQHRHAKSSPAELEPPAASPCKKDPQPVPLWSSGGTGGSNASLKDARSDSSHTDTEDVQADGLHPSQRPPLPLAQNMPKPLITASVRPGLNAPLGPPSPGTSPPGKKSRPMPSPFSPPGRQFLMKQGAPPSQEEFQRFVSQHNFSVSPVRPPSLSTATDTRHRHASPSSKQTGAHEGSAPLTIPMSVLAARVAASKRESTAEPPLSLSPSSVSPSPIEASTGGRGYPLPSLSDMSQQTAKPQSSLLLSAKLSPSSAKDTYLS